MGGRKVEPILEGTRIVSFTHFLFGPMGVQTLADLGADVIAIEPVGGCWQRNWGGADSTMVDGQSVLFLAVDRGKRSIAINLKAADGIELARRIIAGSGVLVTNYRPGVLEKFGLGYDDLKDDHPGLVYAAASGYGVDGPYVDKPGQDLLIQAMSGIANFNGTAETGPRPIGVSAVDHHGAALLALGVVGALLRRMRTGRGGRVDVSLLSSALDLQAESLVTYLNGPRNHSTVPPKHIGGWLYGAPYGNYATTDGHIAISLGSLKPLAEILESEALAAFKDSENYTRREAIAGIIAERVATRTSAEWLEVLSARGIWCAPVNDYEAVEKDPQVVHNGQLKTVTSATGAPVTLVAHPIRYDGETPAIDMPPQPLGTHTDEIMLNAGYSNADIERLEREGVIGRCPEGEAL
ncbi:MAG: CoA transferase [Rhodospirillales bacterium]|jgi:crotonobetainyl-CoA:carnitine CoA-transferase CaiB-like acyl-CoA transferase|nr:CoA transferase [Rhodospirillales bacterium]